MATADDSFEQVSLNNIFLVDKKKFNTNKAILF